MRAAAALLTAALLLPACARARPPAAPPAPEVGDQLANAAALVRVGCFDCLAEALGQYDAIRSLPNVRAEDADAAAIGGIRSALLLDVRQRELGMADDGYLQRARTLIGAREDRRAAFDLHIATVDSVPWRVSRFNVPAGDEALRRMQELRANYPALLEARRAAADADPLAAYGWLAFFCTHSGSREDRSSGVLLEPMPQMRDAPIVAYRLATCQGPEATPLTDLLERQPRYVEITYWLGQVAMGRIQLEEADRLFSLAYKWRPRWPAVTASLGNVYFAFEENARALELFDETLALVPDHPEALIGRVKGLSLVGRHDEAFAAIDAILAGETRVFPGEAYYWRAWNDMQIGQVEQAWTDIEQANRLWVNSEVLKLGGIIAYRRDDLEVAKERFRASSKIAPEDCETRYYLGNVHAEQRDWPATASVFTATATCIERARDGLRKEIASIEASDWNPDRKARQIARREQQIAGGTRMLATSWFNIAVAHYNLGRREEARRFAERVVDDEQFAERARQILNLPQ